MTLPTDDNDPATPATTAPVSHIRASGIACTDARALFHGARIAADIKGDHLGVEFRGAAAAPRGWTCRQPTTFFRSKDRRLALGSIAGEGYQCTSRSRTLSFDEGTVTPWPAGVTIDSYAATSAGG